MKNKKIIIIVLIIIISITTFVYFIIKDKNLSSKSSTTTTDSIDININTDDDDEKIDWSKYENSDYELSKSITITESGIYNLTGQIEDGTITIDTQGNVKLILNNVNIKNNNGPAIYVANAEDVVISTTENSYNYLEDGQKYSGYEDEVIGTIYSHDDITFDGVGTLEIKSNNEDAIVSKDDLKIVSGTYIINSSDDGIRGKDSVYIQNGNFNINCLGDAIKSTNDTDTEKGYILIENGQFKINSTLDAIQSQTKLLIKNGSFNITTGGGSQNTSQQESWGNWRNQSTRTDTESAKGLKAGDNLVIENGEFEFDTSDDAIHCNNYAGIKNGKLTISSGDDGIHADTELIIDDGEIIISKSYEGLEASKITINNGNINIASSDDGINIAGGNDSSAMNRPGANNYSNTNDNILTINGGSIYVNATGDGIDVNGSAYINGGIIKVDGPTNSGNGSLDYDNIFEVNGGTLLAGGSNGMLQSCSSSSKIYNVTISFSTTYGNNDIVSIVDESNKEIISYTSTKNYSSLIVATEKFKKGETYTIKINNLEYQSFTVKNITTTVGNAMNMPGGNMGNRR